MVSPEHEESSSSPNADISVISVRWGTAESAVRVELSDGSLFFILISQFDSQRFSEGTCLAEDDLDYLREGDEHFRAQHKAIELQARREHSTFELQRKLAQRGFSSALTGRVCRDMEASGLLDDTRYAELFVRSRLRRRPEGRFRMEMRLRAKGVSPEICREVLDVFYTTEQVREGLEAATAAIERRRGELEIEELRRELMKRGFSYAEISLFLKKELF